MNEQRRTTSAVQPGTTDSSRQGSEQSQSEAQAAASRVGDTAAERGREVKTQARRHATSIVDDAKGQLRSHAEEEAQRAGSALSSAGEQLQALAEGRVDEAGVLGDYVGVAADAVNRWADTIRERGLDGLLDDARTLGRRRPGAFLAGALAAGLIAGRLGRNVAPELQDGDEGGAVQSPTRDDGRGLTSESSDRDRTTGGSAETSQIDDTTVATTGGGTMSIDRDAQMTQRYDTVGPERRDINVEHDRDDALSDRATGGGSHTGEDDVIVGYASDEAVRALDSEEPPRRGADARGRRST